MRIWDLGLRIADLAKAKGKGQRAEGAEGKRNDVGCGIWDCAHVKSALPFHIRENLTGQGLRIWGKRRAEGPSEIRCAVTNVNFTGQA